MAKKVLIVLADGFEEIEAVTSIDVLRRADLEVVVAGLVGTTVRGAHDIVIQADVSLNRYSELPDAIVLPGGMPGSKNLGASKKLTEILQRMNRENKMVAAICAAPALALGPAGVLDGKKATCYPGFEQHFSKSVSFSEDRVVVDGNVVTSRGPGSALEFALQLVERLVGRDTASQLREGLLVIAPQAIPSLRGGRRPTKQSTSSEIASASPDALPRNDFC